MTKAPHTVLRVAGEDLLSLKPENGGMSISAKIYSADRKLVSQIIDNQFHINPSNYFRKERPDLHSLSVFNQQGERVLYVRYLNPSTIKILGVFNTARGPIHIDEDAMRGMGFTFSGNCNVNVGTAIQID